MIKTNKYLKLYVNTAFPMKRIVFTKNGTVSFALNLRYCKKEESDFTSFVSTPFDIGDEFTAEIDGEEIFAEQCDTMELAELYSEPLRPRVHFTVANGWNNDPNGLIKYKGEYHMFYQYNPCAPQWENMHWGHAVSSDMLTWRELDAALLPDALGTMYSGSAIEKNNGDMMLFYTAAGTHNVLGDRSRPYVQCAAVSKDGYSFEKLDCNPIIDCIGKGNRDPKVVYSKSLSKYLMALYLDEGKFPKEPSEYAFLVSDDLIKWDIMQRFTLDSDSECPDINIFEKDGKEIYVIIGAANKYIIGCFEDGKFVQKTPTLELMPPCPDYAGQSFSGMGDRHVRIGWQRINVKNNRFSQQMGIPFEIELIEGDGNYSLITKPIKEIESLYLETVKPLYLPEDLAIDAYDIRFTKGEEALSLNLFGNQIDIPEGSGEVRIIADTCSVELWWADYTKRTVHAAIMKEAGISVLDGANISDISITRLKSIHG